MRLPLRPTRRQGAAIVELAVVLPLFLLIILGLIEASRLGMVAQLLTTAARDGCRYAVVQSEDSIEQREAEAVQRVEEFLLDCGIPIDSGEIQLTSSDDAYTMTIAIPFQRVSWLPSTRFFGDAVVQGTATMMKETY